MFYGHCPKGPFINDSEPFHKDKTLSSYCLSDRRFSCRVLPPQLAATTDGWEGVMYTAVPRLLQSLNGSHATVPLIIRGVRQKEQNTQEHTAQRLEAICLKTCYRPPSDEQQSHHTTDACSPPFTEYSHPKKYAYLIPLFDHRLTSSTEVLAKRLIGTCA